MVELFERLEKANKTLLAMAAQDAETQRWVPYERIGFYRDRQKHLTSKAEGVRLAISYIEESLRR